MMEVEGGDDFQVNQRKDLRCLCAVCYITERLRRTHVGNSTGISTRSFCIQWVRRDDFRRADRKERAWFSRFERYVNAASS